MTLVTQGLNANVREKSRLMPIIVQQNATIYSLLYFCKLLYSRDGLTSVRCCNYSYTCSWWWVESPPETCRTVYRNIINCL